MKEWISVEDRLPEKGEDCLVSYDGSKVTIAWMNNETWLSPKVCWFFIDGDMNDVVSDGRITHWMPLPEAPCNNNT